MKKYAGVMQRVRDIEYKYGIKYAKTDGKLYKSLKVIYLIAGIWTLIMNLFFALGIFLTYSDTDGMGGFTNSLITVGVCSLLVIVGYVLSCVRLYEPSAVISIVSCVLTAITFAPLQEDTLGLWGYAYSFYWRHLGPNALMIVLMVWMTVLAVRARIKTNKQYKKVTENLFAQYKTQDLTDEQWEEFLKNYTPYEKMRITKDEG